MTLKSQHQIVSILKMIILGKDAKEGKPKLDSV